MSEDLEKKFKEKYDALNDQQREAVDATEGPVMVLAGPGTGKTQILALRIGNILKKTDTPPSGILALTFTEAGVKEMKRRLRLIIGTTAEEVRIHTYHGFAASVISEFPDHFPHLSRTKQITEIEAETLVRSILKEKKFSKLRPSGEPDFYVSKILGAIKDSKKEAWIPEGIRSFAKEEIRRIHNDESYLSTRGPTKGQLKGEGLKRIEKCERTLIFADVYEAYEMRKKEEKKMDFDDLIMELLSALREDKLLLQILQENFLYILIDEHQDTNDSQNILIRTISNFFETPNIFVVGDEKQAIYRFQGASVENFLQFQNLWKSMKVISLTDNYRSHQKILDASFSMIEKNYAEGEHKDLRIKLLANGKDEPNPLDVIMAGNNEAADKYLVENIKEITKNHPEGTVAIITRRNRDVEHIISLLEKNNVPAQAERGADIFSHPVGALFFDLVAYLRNVGDIESLSKTIVGGLWNLNFGMRTILLREIRSGNLSKIEKEIPAIKKLQGEINKDGSLEYLIRAAELSGFTKISIKNPLSAEIWRSIVVLAQDLASENFIQSPSLLIEKLLEYRLSAETKSIKITVGRPGSQIRIMTAHGSKGLEFDYVFLPYATEESWLSRGHGTYFILPREKGNEDEIRDARRLFYVAITRARKHVSIICGLEDGLQKIYTPLRFISELDPSAISQTDIPAVFENKRADFLENIDLKRKTEMINYAKSIMQESGLSVTALNHFMVCPSQFLYKSILKIPEAPSVSSEKGTAMHEALSYVWHQDDKSEIAIVASIENTVRSYFERSLLPHYEKGSALEDLLLSVPKVVATLGELFSLKGKISTESWVETLYEGNYLDEKIKIPLHGKLDLMIDGEDKTFVYDYKTKEAMSVNAIKGETKNSDGNYFRQLIFYKILLGGNSRFKNKKIESALVFIKPDAKGRCPIIFVPVDKIDEERVRSEIQSLVESVWSGKFLTDLCDDKSCEWCALKKETLGYL